MPVFAYKAADSTGKLIRGSMEASDESHVVGSLQDMGYIPIRINAAGGRRTGLTGGLLHVDIAQTFSSVFSRITNKDILRFTNDLSALLEAGLPVDRALSILVGSMEKGKFNKVVEDVLKSIQGGLYLSDALARHPQAFSDFYVNMVRAGESGGVLEAVLVRLGSFLEESQELIDYIKSALIYPLFLVFVGGASIIVLMTFVIPKFAIIFSDMGQNLPLSTKVLLWMSSFLKAYWWLVIFTGFGLFLLFRWFKSRPEGRYRLDQLKLKVPVFSEVARSTAVARFARTLGTLIRSGVPILQALLLVKGVIDNQVVVRSLVRVHDRVKEGDRLSQPLEESEWFPPLALQMIRVGEESGRLEEMFLRVGENYEKAVRNRIKRLISFLEPFMILVMGLIVGFIVISMLMAIFSMNDMPF